MFMLLSRTRALVGCVFLCASILSGPDVGGVEGSQLSQERYHVTTFGAERRARWSLEGKTAIVTGGTKGIGKAVVEELACLGAKVLTCSRNSADVEACLQDWKSKGLTVHGTTADVTTAEGREALASMAEKHFGGLLDILVNNVGTSIRKATVDYTPEELAHVMDTNFTSLFLLTQLLHPMLKAAAAVKGAKENGGSSVVNVSSVAGITSVKTGTPYAASKAAMNQASDKKLGMRVGPGRDSGKRRCSMVHQNASDGAGTGGPLESGRDNSTDPDRSMGGSGRSQRHGGVPLHERRRVHHVSGRRHRRRLHGQRLDDVAGLIGYSAWALATSRR